MKIKYPIETKDLRHHPVHLTSKKFNHLKNMALILIKLDLF